MYIDSDKMIQKLQQCAAYTDEAFPWKTTEKADPLCAKKIRKYFKENTELDLDAIAASEKTTWEKTLEISQFVSKHIPHDNQKEPIDRLNAISLWEYGKRVLTGFNCRWHSILLSELLLAIGIKNRFITCLPEDKTDVDCHVVNLVWLPEKEKWAMIDSDMKEYVTAEDGTPMSLSEMREALIAGRSLNIHQYAHGESVQFLQAYWAKNLYWFNAHLTYGFGLEDTQSFAKQHCVCLLPPGYDHTHFTGRYYRDFTTNAEAFWRG